MLVSETATPSALLPSAAAEAARYALLRRLAPAMRHDLVVNLQPIGMVYEVMDRRLRAPEPDLAQVRDGAQKIHGLARAALKSSLDVIGWIAPEDAATTTIAACANECSALLSTSLSFRGYALRNEVGDVPGAIGRSAARTLLSAALMHTTDHVAAPADLVVTAAAQGEAVRVDLQLQASRGGSPFTTERGYRKIGWDDILALAEADAVALSRLEAGLRLTFPCVPAA